VTQDNVKSTICKGGWTGTIRPKSLAAQERQSLVDYNTRNGTHLTTKAVEYDHLVSLELGGAPSDTKNLWPEPEAATGSDGKDAGSKTKDALESYLNARVCGRRKPLMTLAQAQALISGNWYKAYTDLGRPPDPYHHVHPVANALPSSSAS